MGGRERGRRVTVMEPSKICVHSNGADGGVLLRPIKRHFSTVDEKESAGKWATLNGRAGGGWPASEMNGAK